MIKKMSKALSFVVLLFVLSASPVFAHTHLEASDPEENTIVTEPLDGIMLYFDTTIEESAVVELQTEDGTPIGLENITVHNNELSADIVEPLENGIYTINWDIIGVDGHPMEDSISFEVDIEETKEEEQIQTDEPAESADQAGEDQEAPNNEVENTTAEDSNTLLVTILLIAIIAVIVIVLLRRKK